MNGKFKIVYHPRVPRWVRGLHIAFAHWLLDHCGVRHRIQVHLYARSSLTVPDGRRCLGFFNSVDDQPFIGLACQAKGRSQNAKLWCLLDTFAHEFCHYEQWRDAKRQDHRGVPQRVRALLRRFDADWRSSER